MPVILLNASLLVILLPNSFVKHSTTGAMASYFRGASFNKPSKDVFRNQSDIYDGTFAKIVKRF